jgi:hypothetical protein
VQKRTIVELPDRSVAAAGGGDTVWCAAGGRLLAFTEDGTRRLDVPLADRVTALAAGPALLVAVLASGAIVWLDAQRGGVLIERPIGGAPTLVSGGGAVWAIDRSTSRAWRLGERGTLGPPRAIPGVDHVAADGDRLWWTTTTATALHDFERTVDLDLSARDSGAMAVCAGSVWISVPGGLARVGAWAAEKGMTVTAPFGPAPFLTCAGGVLVGASAQGVFVLDPSADADARTLDVDTNGDIGALVAVGRTAWIFSALRAEAQLVSVRT